jgi:hypothetical protein
MRGADVDEADAEAVDLPPELWEQVEPLTSGGEVVVLQPVPAQLADPVQWGALRPAAGGRGSATACRLVPGRDWRGWSTTGKRP